MSLLTSLGFARSSLFSAGEMSSVVSRNIANVGVAGATRKIVSTVSTFDGGVSLGIVQRATDATLYQHVLTATSDQGSQTAIATGLGALDQTIGDPSINASPAALVAKLKSSLQQFSVTPSDFSMAQSTVATAKQLSAALNTSTQSVQSARQDADSTIAQDVDSLNGLLDQFGSLNNAIATGTLAGRDVTDQLDQRDNLVTDMSKLIGITVVHRANDDMALYTDSGVPLFETTARRVTFSPTSAFSPGTNGNAVFVDSVQVTGAGSPMAIQSGEIAGAAQFRDRDAVNYQAQLDEIARGLIGSFAENAASPVPMSAPGLFTYPGAPAFPTVGQSGLAGAISVAASVDPTLGGNAFLLRDGGIAGPAFTVNTSGVTGYSGQLLNLIDALSAQQPFSPAAGLTANASLADFSSASVAWLGGARQAASDSASYKNTVLQTSSQALSNATGINLDDQMMRLLDIERSYQASSKLLTTVNNMYDTLFAAIVPGVQ